MRPSPAALLAPNEATLSRLGLFALGLAEWPWAHRLLVTGALVRHGAGAALVLLLFGSSLALLVLALGAAPERSVRSPVLLGAVFALLVVASAYGHPVEQELAPLPRTTDGQAYMELAARLLLHGQNPYRASLLEAYRVFELPLSMSTPLVDGDVSDRVAYPALSFLILVPFLVLRIPIYLVYGGAFLAAIGLVAVRAPGWARALVLALFFHDPLLVSLGFTGVNDGVWILFVVGAILAWHERPTLAFALLGLACAHKQQAWFLVPLLLVLVHHEQRTTKARFLAIVGAAFLAPNLGFLVAGPRAWVLGIGEPLVAPMITLSEGLTALTMTGRVVFPKVVLKGLFWLAYASAFAAFLRHPRALRHALWMLPAAALWFSNRALLSYWVPAAIPALASLVAMPAPPGEDRASARRTLHGLALAATAALVAIAGAALRAPPFEVTATGPAQVLGRRIVRARLRVTNRSGGPARPRFAVQGGPLQPLPWRIENGPSVLGVDESADYVVTSALGHGTLDATLGGRIAVTVDGDPSRATFLELRGDRALGVVDEVPNGDFALVDRGSGTPTGWTFHPEGAGVALDVTPDASLELRFAAVDAPEARRAELTTILAVPEVPVDVRILVPAEANVPPFDRLYGVRLAVGAARGWVLFGAVGEGTLPTGERFVGLAAPRGAFTTVRLDLRALLGGLGIPLVRIRAHYERAPDLDLPSIPLALALIATVPDGHAAAVTFGAIHTQPRDIDALVKAGIADPAGLAAWHAALEIDMRNHKKAAELAAAAVALEPTAQRLFVLGEEERQLGNSAAAIAAYERSLAAGLPTRGAAIRGMARAAAATDCGRARAIAERLVTELGEPPFDPCAR